MKRLNVFVLGLLLMTALPLKCVAQGSAGAAQQQGKQAQTAAALYEEASNYSSKKFQEFAQKKIAFNPKLLEQTLKEQRELSARSAALLVAREGLAGEDLFYLGMLYNLAEDGQAAVTFLRRYLDAKPADAKHGQGARYVLSQLAAKLKLFDEAERALADYLKNQPQTPGERVRMEDALARALLKS